MATKKKQGPGRSNEGPSRKVPDRPSDLGAFPARSVPDRYKKYVKHAGYRCKKCPFQTSKKDNAGRQALRAHKRLHIRERKARRRGLLASVTILGMILFATAQLLDAAMYFHYILEYRHIGLLILLGLSLVVFTISVAGLNGQSIRKEFYRAMFALVPFSLLSLALILVKAPTDPIHPLLPPLVRWAPLLALLAISVTLPKLAKTWNTTGLNPRLRPEYEELVEFNTLDDQLRIEDMITHLEFRAVTGRSFRTGPVTGKEPALGELKKMKRFRYILMNRDARRMNTKRGIRCRDDMDIMLKMANLEL